MLFCNTVVSFGYCRCSYVSFDILRCQNFYRFMNATFAVMAVVAKALLRFLHDNSEVTSYKNKHSSIDVGFNSYVK